jgi:tetratricopeptide (TPR) repeat protein
MSLFRRLFSHWFGDRQESPSAEQAKPHDLTIPRTAPAHEKDFSPRATPLPLPESLGRPGENSPLVAYQQGNTTVVMDREAFEYAFGDDHSPGTAQRDLDELAAKITRICVLEGGLYLGRATGGRVLIDLADPQAIQDLLGRVRIIENSQPSGDCDCPGGPTMELYGGLVLIATIGLQHGRAIRWNRWPHDAPLQDGDQLTRGLEKYGIRAALLQSIYQRRKNLGFAESKLSEREQKAQELGGRAEQQAKAGDLAAAVELCTQAIQLAPDRPEGYAFRARVNNYLGKLPEAAADCSAAIDRGLRNAEIYFIRAVAEQSANQIEQALADCSLALHVDPEHITGYNLRGFLHVSRGQIKDGLADFAKAIRMAPGWPLPYWNRITAHKLTSNWDGVIADASKIIQILQAALVERLPEKQPAVDSKESDLSESQSFLSAAYVERALAHEAKGRIEQAGKDFDESLHVMPESLPALSARAWFRFRRDQIAESLADFTEVIRLAPDDSKAYVQRGMAHLNSRKYAEAVADFTSALQRSPNDPGTYTLRGQANAMDGKYDQALADAEQAIRLAPHRLECYWPKVRSLGQQAKYREEIALLEKMHWLYPDDVATCNMLAWRLSTCPDPQFRDGGRAVELATHGCEKSSWKEPHVIDTLAAACAEVGKFEDACTYEERSMKLLPAGTDLKKYEARLATYRSGQPHRAPPADSFLN